MAKRFRSAVGVALAASLLSFGVASAGMTSANADDAFSGMASSDSAATPVVAEGTVLDSSQNPVSDGTVLLYAWPAEEENPNLAVGTTLQMTLIGRADTDSSGSYAMHVYQGADLSADVTREGTVNTEMQAYDGDNLSSITALSISPAASNTGTAASPTPADDNSSNADIAPDQSMSNAPSDDPTLPPDPPTPTASPSPTSGIPTPKPGPGQPTDPIPVNGPMAVGGSGATADAPQQVDLNGTDQPEVDTDTSSGDVPDCCGYPKKCSSTFDSKVGVKYGIVGATYANTTGIEHTFHYAKGSSTKFSIGVKTPFGYSSEGSREVASTTTVGFGTFGKAYRYHTTGFMVESWSETCQTGPDGPKTTTHQLRPEYWTGGAYSIAAGTPSAHYCSKQGPGTDADLDYSKALTWTNGLSFEYKGYGVDLSMETGYNSDTSAYYKNTSTVTKYFCGMTDYYPRSPGIVEGKASNS